jgi:hypothetical protein
LARAGELSSFPFFTETAAHGLRSYRALVAAASKYSTKLLVGHHRRFVRLGAPFGCCSALLLTGLLASQNPYIVNTKKILESGSLGRGALCSSLLTTDSSLIVSVSLPLQSSPFKVNGRRSSRLTTSRLLLSGAKAPRPVV